MKKLLFLSDISSSRLPNHFSWTRNWLSPNKDKDVVNTDGIWELIAIDVVVALDKVWKNVTSKRWLLSLPILFESPPAVGNAITLQKLSLLLWKKRKNLA